MGAAALLAACATPGGVDRDARLHDPLEKINRATFGFNIALDDAIGKPVAKAYRDTFPRKVRNGIRNFVDNLKSPVTLVNDLLQGEAARAQTTMVRLLVNSTVGIGGLSDVAAESGVPGHEEDFGQTLAVWGIDPGPYLVVPLLGPHTMRHLAGRTTDAGLYPPGDPTAKTGLGRARLAVTAVDVVDKRERLIGAVEGLRRTSLDFYTATRSSYWQGRVARIRNGRVPAGPPDDDIDIDDEDSGAATGPRQDARTATRDRPGPASAVRR